MTATVQPGKCAQIVQRRARRPRSAATATRARRPASRPIAQEDSPCAGSSYGPSAATRRNARRGATSSGMSMRAKTADGDSIAACTAFARDRLRSGRVAAPRRALVARGRDRWPRSPARASPRHAASRRAAPAPRARARDPRHHRRPDRIVAATRPRLRHARTARPCSTRSCDWARTRFRSRRSVASGACTARRSTMDFEQPYAEQPRRASRAWSRRPRRAACACW